MSYQRGQILPLDRSNEILGSELLRPVWHAVLVPANKDKSTALALRAKGCGVFYPQRQVHWLVKGKRIERAYPQIAGIIYVKFKHAPQWHAMRNRGLIRGVISLGDQPIRIPSEIIRRLQGLPGREEALRQARMDLMQLSVGDTAQMPDGILQGHFVQVSEVKADGTVWWLSLAGIKGQSSPGQLVKDGGPSEAEVQARADEIMQGDEQGVA